MPQKPALIEIRRPEIVFGVLVFMSGMAALGHQLLWTRRLIDLLGASGESSARVFGTFFLGLSTGSAIAALLIQRIRNPLRVAGFVQLSIPLLILPVVYLSSLTDWIWPALGFEIVGDSNGFAIKSFLTLAFVVPPAAMMGLSFPLIVAGVLRLDASNQGRSGINLYAVNTLGGAFGLLLTVMVVVPQLGSFASMILAGAVDGVVGILLLLGSRASGDSIRENKALAANRPQENFNADTMAIAIGLAFLSGMAVLALEVTAFQMFQLAATISLFSPVAVLFCAIASLGIAAAVFSRYESTFLSKTKDRTIVWVLALGGILVVLAPQIFMGIAQRSNWFIENESVADFVFKLVVLAMISVGPAWLVGGLIFPFAIGTASEGCNSTRSSQRLGILLAVNGIGGLLGAELAYRFLLPRFGVYGSMTVIAFGFAMMALIYSLFSSQDSTKHSNRVSACTSIVAVLLLAFANSSLPVINPPPGVKTIDIQSGREGTVAVVEDQRGERSILVANQYLLGGTSVRYDQERQVLLPIALHKKPVAVGCIGLATGITPGAALTIPSVEEVMSIEISPLVARAAETYFGEFNHDFCNHESSSVVIGDGRTYIASLADKFDVITGDLFLPWEPGTSRLYSREHFASVRRALKTDGVFCQWLPMYQLTSDQFRQIADTFASEFGETHLFLNHFRVSFPMIALVGRNSESACLDWESVRVNCDHLRRCHAIRDPILRHEFGIRMLYLGPWQPDPQETQLLSLADASLEYSAASVRLSGDPQTDYFGPENWTGFCNTHQQRCVDSNPQLSNQAPMTTLATELLKLDEARQTRRRIPDSVVATVIESIPRCIADDRLADWNRWPGVRIRQFD